MVRRTIGLAAVLGLVALPSSRAEAGILTTFQDAMQAGSPAQDGLTCGTVAGQSETHRITPRW